MGRIGKGGERERGGIEIDRVPGNWKSGFIGFFFDFFLTFFSCFL